MMNRNIGSIILGRRFRQRARFFVMPMSARSASLAEVLDEMTREGAGELTERLAGGDLRCYACGHRCLIHEGKRGICKVSFNEGGRLLVPATYVAELACDPT